MVVTACADHIRSLDTVRRGNAYEDRLRGTKMKSIHVCIERDGTRHRIGAPNLQQFSRHHGRIVSRPPSALTADSEYRACIEKICDGDHARLKKRAAALREAMRTEKPADA
ncbi:hypothetical protein [Acuticoccus kandeliae]|uniref:hypothetical protein n=1 Tax=Acuticoccus kandeliae TaxID=2073160 RepID=UPI0013006615|nr:hypothetical protein [Acuticoccus kandeliae]